MNAARTAAPATITAATIPPIAPLEMAAPLELAEAESELLCVTALDVVYGLEIVVTTSWVVGMTDGTAYTVEVALVLGGGGGRGTWPLRIAENDGGTTLTVAHWIVNQFEVS